MDVYQGAMDDVSVGNIYLRNNPLWKRPLALSDLKATLFGEGSTPDRTSPLETSPLEWRQASRLLASRHPPSSL